MPDLDSIKNQMAAEVRVIKDAPLTIAAAVIAIGLGVWSILSWAESTIISGKDATIESLKAQIDAYKDKLGGASPDQAKARIDELESRLSKIEPRRISDDQRRIILRLASHPQGNIENINVTSDSNCYDCRGYSESLQLLLHNAGWNVGNGVVMGPSEISRTGMIVFTSDVNNPPLSIKLLINAFREAKIPFDVIQKRTEIKDWPAEIQINEIERN